MSVNACAALVERGDPDRFMAAMAAAPSDRLALFPLYALNLEAARAPWVTSEPMIAEMRLQWWRDLVEEIGADAPPRAHEVAAPLADVIRKHALPIDLLDELVAARRWDVYRDAFEDQDDFDRHLNQTSGHLMWLSALALGADAAQEPAARDVGFAMGVAGWLQAVPELQSRGRIPLVDGRDQAVADLAKRGLDRLSQARGTRFGAATSAIRAGWRSESLLKQVVANPGIVADGQMGTSEGKRRGTLLWRSLTNRW